MAKKTLYLLLDTETTMKNGMVFDMAFSLFDRKGKRYEHGSFLFKDVLAIEEPFYKDKIAEYWNLAYKRKVKPMSVRAVRRYFNNMLENYLANNKVIMCAYNAAFDTSHLGMTSENMVKKPFLSSKAKGLQFLDLWYAWVQGCPKNYGKHAPWTHEKPGTINPKNGRPLPWNIKTSAEAVYQFITKNPFFIEKHMAHSDIEIEQVILMDILKRKQKLPVVSSPKEFQAMPWKLAQERCKEYIIERIGKEQLLMETQVPDLTEKTGHMKEIQFPKLDSEIREERRQAELEAQSLA